MSWIDNIDIKNAIREVQFDERHGNDFCIDPLRFDDLSKENVIEGVIIDVQRKLEQSSFSKLLEIDVPKENYTLRPGSRPNLIEWVAYTAVVNYIGSEVHKRIPEASFSFMSARDRFNKRRGRKVDYWLKFDEKSRSLSKVNSFLATTDIVSFFEHISLEELKRRLLLLSRSEDYQSAVNYLVDNILIKWTQDNRVQGFGLPQGPTTSTILADIYLYSVDRDMSKFRTPFIRYMDDIRLYARTKQDLKRGIALMVRSLRELKLNLNAKKTCIYKTDNVKEMEMVFDPKKQTLDLIDRALNSRHESQIRLVIPSLMELWTLSLDSDNTFSDRYFRFFVRGVIDLMRFDIVGKPVIGKLTKDFLNLLKEKHHWAKHICWFLVATATYHQDIKSNIVEDLIKFIADKESNIYEWEEMWVLDTIRQIGGVRRRGIINLKNYSSKNELCQSQLALIVAENGSNDDRENILDIMRSTQLRDDQKRSYFLALKEIPRNVLVSVERKVPVFFRDYVYNLEGKNFGFKYSLKERNFVPDRSGY
jgi:hypothetical protein